MSVIRGLIFDNLGLKFVSLLLAVAVYLDVYTDRPATMLLSFPLQFTDVPDSLSLSGPAPAAVQAENAEAGHALAGAGLADDAERLATRQRERHTIDRFDETVVRAERDAQVPNVQERLGSRRSGTGGGRLGEQFRGHALNPFCHDSRTRGSITA